MDAAVITAIAVASLAIYQRLKIRSMRREIDNLSVNYKQVARRRDHWMRRAIQAEDASQKAEGDSE